MNTKSNHPRRRIYPLAGALLAGWLLSSQASAQVNYDTSGDLYTENFDAGLSSSAANLPWTDNSVFAGWSAYQISTSGAPAEYRRTGGDSSLAEVFQWRDGAGASDGAFGSKPNDTTGDILRGIQITNASGATLDSITIGYTGEQWYESGIVQNNQLVVAYQVGSPTNLSAGSWTEIPSLIFDTPQNTGAGQNLDGNAAANRVVFTPTAVTISGWDGGTDLWIRWFDSNSSGVDQGLGIDDFSFSAVPEPSQYAILFGLCALMLTVCRRQGARK
jgi:hypothetical protein